MNSKDEKLVKNKTLLTSTGMFLSVLLVAALVGVQGQIGNVAADEEMELKADLLDANGTKAGEAKFESEESSELKIEIEEFVPSTVFDASSNGTSFTLIATDSEGDGEAEFEPSPIMVMQNQTITLDDGAGNVLSGTFQVEGGEDEEEEEDKEE